MKRCRGSARYARTLRGFAALKREQEDFDRAAKLLTTAQEILTDTLGKNDIFVATGNMHLATILSCQGRHAEARNVRAQALTVLRHHERSGTIQSGNAVFETASRRLADGALNEAEALFWNSKTLYTNACGEESTEVAKVYNALSDCLEKQGRTREASVYAELAKGSQ